MKKTITLILAASALTLALGATACSTGGIALGGTDQNPASSENVYGVSAATAGMLIQSMETTGQPTQPGSGQDQATDPGATPETAPEQSAQPETTPDATVSAFPELDDYMGLVDSFLNGSGYSILVERSDRTDYEEMMKVSYRGLIGSTEYEMHYNKVLIPDFDDDRDDRWDDEEEEEYAIEGVLLIEGIEYPVSGIREIERERNEYESETQFRVTLENGKTIWVEQSESSEKHEHELEYSYIIREKGRVVERSSFSFEEEGNETELELITERDGKREVFCFEEETYRGKEYLTLRIGSGRETKSYRVLSDGNGGYTYEPLRR